MNIEKIIREVFNEAKKGLVTIDSNGGYWSFFVKFYINNSEAKDSLNNKYPIVKVDDYKRFVNKVKEYLNVAYDFYNKDMEYFDLIDDEPYLKKLFLDLICNATIYNLNNIEEYIDLKTQQLKDKKITPQDEVIGNYGSLKIVSRIDKNPSNLEAPYKMSISFVDDNNDTFTLPSITFGVIDNKVYVMCVQNLKRNSKESVLSKKLDRYFRKINKGVDFNDEISNVSPSALVALTIFCRYLSNIGVNEMVAVNFMPIRYNNNRVKVFNKYKNDEEKKKENIEKVDYIQSNITEKFMNLFLRYAYHFDGCDIEYDDLKDEMNLVVKETQNRNDNIIYDLDDSVKNFKNIRLTRK